MAPKFLLLFFGGLRLLLSGSSWQGKLGARTEMRYDYAKEIWVWVLMWGNDATARIRDKRLPQLLCLRRSL